MKPANGKQPRKCSRAWSEAVFRTIANPFQGQLLRHEVGPRWSRVNLGGGNWNRRLPLCWHCPDHAHQAEKERERRGHNRRDSETLAIQPGKDVVGPGPAREV